MPNNETFATAQQNCVAAKRRSYRCIKDGDADTSIRRRDGTTTARRQGDSMAGKNVHEITEANFQKTVLGSDKPFLVDFWATWCGPCLAIAPHVEALADANVGKLEVGKVNIDDHPGVAGQFGVRSIPTLILFKGGKPVDQIVGAVPRAKLEEMVKKHA
jgi:thioredoxin 1